MMKFHERIAITAKHREDWYRAMGKTADDGLPQIEVLNRMQRNFSKTKHPMSPLIRELLRRLQGGGTKTKSNLGAATLRTVGTEINGLVPPSESMLILAGDQSGRKADGFYNAAEHVASQGKMLGTITASLAKPIGYLLAVFTLLLFFSIKILPAFEKGRPREIWPSEAKLLGLVADHVFFIAGGSFCLIILLGILLAWLIPNWTGQNRDWADRHLFPFPLVASINGASLLTSIAGYISAGIPFIDAISNIGKGGSPYMLNQCNRVISMIRNGKRPEECLLSIPIVQSRYHWLIDVYGMSSDASAAYKTIAAEMVSRTQDFIRNIFDRVIGNLLLAFIGAMLMWIYLSMFAIVDATRAA